MLTWLLAACVPQEPLPLTVDGVLAERGKPVAGVELVTTTGQRGHIDGGMLWSSGYAPPRVLARQLTDGDGAFRLALALPQNRNFGDDEPSVSAWRDGRCVGVWLTDPSKLVPGNALRWELDGDGPARVVVQDPEGRACAGATVRVGALRLGQGCVVLPADLSARLVATTGNDGAATITGCAGDRLAGIEVTSVFGVQHIASRRDGSGLDVVRLRSCGTLQLRTRGAAAPPGLVVTVRSTPFVPRGQQPDQEQRRHQATARFTAGADGRFAAGPVAAGTVLLDAIDGGLVGIAKTVEIAAGASAELEVELAPPIRLEGVVQDQDGKPVANAPLRSAAQRMTWTTSDAAGRFSLPVRAGAVSVAVSEAPAGYLLPDGPFFGVRHEVPSGVESHSYPPIVLARGADARGSVVDVAGRPVAGAKVTVQWQQEAVFGRERSMQTRTRHAATGADGTFVVVGLPADERLEWTAAFGARATKAPLPAESARAGGVELVLAGADAAPRTLAITVRDVHAKPVAGARVAITRHKFDPKVMYSPEPFLVAGEVEPAVDVHGELVVPVDAQAKYCAMATVAGHDVACSDWRAVGDDDVRHAIDLVLTPLVAVEGTVLEADGTAVPAATVFHLVEGPRATTALTGDRGRFRLDGLRRGTVILLARAGERLGMAVVRSDAAAAVTIRLAPRQVQPAPAADEAAVRALSLQALAPLVAALPAAESSVRLRALQALAWHDPARALELADTVPWPEPWYASSVKGDVARALLERDRDEALMVARALSRASSRCLALLAAQEPMPPAAPERRGLLTEALLAARVSESPQMQVAMLANVAEAFSDDGDEAAAAGILADARLLVDGLPSEDWAGYARCLYAEQLARVDVEAALPFVQQQKDSFSRDRHRGNIAHELAGRDPAAAERVFALLSHPDRFAARVCYRMAPVDLARARRLAATRGVEPGTRVWCSGVMAEAIAAEQPEAARNLLDEALTAACAASLPEHAAALLPCLQRVDAAAVPAAIARLLAARQPGIGVSFDGVGLTMGRRLLLALQLRPFDAETAAALAEPVWACAPAFACSESRGSGSTRFAALLGWLDPERAAAVVAAWTSTPA
ncbi:MAG TPA: carboxypeptidase-like regulatory domain-containing protein, partial [Planctomycetota bacterium]